MLKFLLKKYFILIKVNFVLKYQILKPYPSITNSSGAFYLVAQATWGLNQIFQKFVPLIREKNSVRADTLIQRIKSRQNMD